MIKCANISQKVGCEAWCDGVPLTLRAKGRLTSPWKCLINRPVSHDNSKKIFNGQHPKFFHHRPH